MGNKQKSVSISEEWARVLEKIFEDNRAILNKLDIDSTPKLVKVLANYGVDPFLAAIADLKEASEKKKAVEKQKPSKLPGTP